ncbi:unnamed protein product [Anisakis simplex]|uniref:Uncharacterized protein n=1 Tax=Anisakis simplex TaxID=6269 RepID=A0A0M3K7I8_ANISI|nr:unnamed protein product [Anisakis simplex]
MNQCEFVDEHEESPVVLKNAFAEEDRTSLQAFDDGGEDDCASCMNIILSTSSEDLTLRPTRSILKKSKETSSCEVKARSSRSKSVTFSMPDETPPRKRKERNPIRKESFCTSFGWDQFLMTRENVRPVQLSVKVVRSESNLPHWITYLQLNQRKRINQMERPKRSDLKQSSESGRFFTYRSHSLNSPSKGGAPFSVTQYRHYDHPFWISSYGEDLSRRSSLSF